MSTNTHATHGTILASGEIKDWIIERGTEMLRNGTSAADVAEQVARDVEDDADDHSVGFSGLPNCLGMVECDASFMDGATLNAGAVGALVDFRHPISVARAVMQRTLHILLVGDGAARFAREIKAEPRTMLTPTAEAIWWERLQALGIDQDALNILRGGGGNSKFTSPNSGRNRPRQPMSQFSQGFRHHECYCAGCHRTHRLSRHHLWHRLEIPQSAR